jgi:peptidoglycan/LPS O-acetylase OafA/YrhL
MATVNLTPQPTPHRVPALDGVRGLAIVLVLVSHFRLGTTPTVADRVYETVALAGNSGVDLFFVLSGFLITGILLDAKDAERGAYFKNFYARRALRILPLYYGVVASMALVWPLVHAPTAAWRLFHQNQWWYWLHATNILFAKTETLGMPYRTSHFWSVAVEEQFYLVWPIVVWYSSRRRLLHICVGCAVLALVLRIALTPLDNFEWIYTLPVTRMDTLVAGAALAVLARGPGGLTPYRGVATRVGGLAVAVWGALYVWSSLSPSAAPVFRTLGYSAIVVTYACLVTLALTTSWGGPMSAPILRFFGKYSYGMYVFHFPLLFFMGPIYAVAAAVPLLGGSHLPSQLVFVVLATALTSAVAFVSWHVYERHFLALKRYFPVATPSPASSPIEAARDTSSASVL